MELNSTEIKGMSAFSYPEYTPVQTQVINFDNSLMQAVLKGHIMIHGDSEFAWHRAMIIAEDQLKVTYSNDTIPEQVIVFGLNSSVFGLDKIASIMRFGGTAHEFPLQAQDGATFAAIATRTRKSMAFNLDCMGTQAMVLFLENFLGGYQQAEARYPATLVFVGLDSMMSRKRMKDRVVASQLHQILTRGPWKGIKVVGTTASPEEVPIEFSRHMSSGIVCTTSVEANIKATANLLDKRLGEKLNEEYGMRRMDGRHHFLYANNLTGDHASKNLAFLPHYLPYRELESNPGMKDMMVSSTSPEENEAISEVRENRKSDAKDEPTARAISKRASRKTSAAKAAKRVIRAKFKKVAIPNHLTDKLDLARCLTKMTADGKVILGKHAKKAELLEMIANDPIISIVAPWMRQNHAKINELAAPGLMGMTLHMALRDDSVRANRFFEALINGQVENPEAHKAFKALQASSADGRTQERLDIITQAWNAYLSNIGAENAPSAANDDVPAGKAA